MNHEFITKYKYLILSVIIVLGYFLRNHNLNVWPRDGATFDEYAWTFLGLSLINTGVPTSWSPHPQYTDKVYYRNPQGASFFLATPYLEHPPLFGLAAGGFAYLNGVRNFDEVRISLVRPLSLAVSLLSICTVYLLAAAVFDVKTGLLSAFFYAVTPTVVNGSKLVQNENFFIPLFLLSQYFSVRLVKDSSNLIRYSLFFILFILPLAKIPWITASGSVAAVFFFHKRWKEGILAILAGLAGVTAYILWGFYWEKTTFLALMGLQLSRYDISFDGIFALITDPLVTDRRYLDGVIYAGWAALFILLTKDIRKIFPLVAGLFAYFFLYLFAIPNEAGHGWYRYPLYPFLIIALSRVLNDVFNRNFVLTPLFLLLIGLPAMEHVFRPLFGFSFRIYRLFLVLVALGALPFLLSGKRFVKTSQSVNWLVVTFSVILTVFSALGYNEQ